MMMWGPYGWGSLGTWGWIWMVINMLLWVGIVVGIVALIVRLVQQPGSAGLKVKDSPLDVLKRRYAAGEIGKEEFERIKTEIKD